MAPEAFAVPRDFGIKYPHAAGTETLSLKLAALNQPPDVALAGAKNISRWECERLAKKAGEWPITEKSA